MADNALVPMTETPGHVPWKPLSGNYSVNQLASTALPDSQNPDLKWIALKTAFLLTITSVKVGGEVYAPAIRLLCMHWLTLWVNLGFLP